MSRWSERGRADPHHGPDFAVRRRAAAIYGSVITAAMLAAFGGAQTTVAAVVVVVVTLVVYWLAEDYAHLLSEQREHGTVPDWPLVRESLLATWTLVRASFLPLLAMVVARLAGASTFAAANVGLVVCVVLLTVEGWLAARAARLGGRQLVYATLIALGFGLAMIILKDVVLLYLK